MNLEQEYYEWLTGYMDKEDARGLAKLLVVHAQRYFKHLYALGILTGMVITAIILMWAK